jgi:hypothetical protein
VGYKGLLPVIIIITTITVIAMTTKPLVKSAFVPRKMMTNWNSDMGLTFFWADFSVLKN